MRRFDICLYLGPADRSELQALRSNRNTPRKLAWRAEIVLATADNPGRSCEAQHPSKWAPFDMGKPRKRGRAAEAPP